MYYKNKTALKHTEVGFGFGLFLFSGETNKNVFSLFQLNIVGLFSFSPSIK